MREFREKISVWAEWVEREEGYARHCEKDIARCMASSPGAENNRASGQSRDRDLSYEGPGGVSVLPETTPTGRELIARAKGEYHLFLYLLQAGLLNLAVARLIVCYTTECGKNEFLHIKCNQQAREETHINCYRRSLDTSSVTQSLTASVVAQIPLAARHPFRWRKM